MMSHTLIQIVITIWLGVHPVRYILPEKYAVTGDACVERAALLKVQLEHLRKNPSTRITTECVEIDGRDA
jgi:hypothetical protein